MEFIRAVIRDLIERRRELRRLVVWTFVLGTIFAWTASGSDYLRDVMSGAAPKAGEFRDHLLWMSIWLYAWVLIVPVIYVMALRLTKERTGIGHIISVYLGGFLFAYIVHVGIQISSMALPAFQGIHPDWAHAVIHHMLSGLLLLSVTYGGIAALCHAIAYDQRAREAEMRRVRLESELVQSRMHALRNQLQPHFLFNALNSVSTLMYRDVKAADDMLVGIADLLRALIKESDRYFVPLQKELEFVSTYLNVEKIRYGERLHVEVNHDEAIDEALVPALILQPVVENAIKHAASQMAGTTEVRISTGIEGNMLHLTVSDNGPGFDPEKTGSGTGLSNLRDRMSHLYGDEQALNIRSGPSGTTVEVSVPLRIPSVVEPVEALPNE